MNKKGFTLVEMIAVVAIIGIVFGIASYSVIGIINSSRKKSEAVFVDGISTYIDEYITLYGSTLARKKDDTGFKFDKCKVKVCEGNSCMCSEVYAYEYNSVSLQELIIKELVTEGKFVNPVNKLDCLAGLAEEDIPAIRIFKDSDYVYYYYVNLSNTSCEISSDNSVINTLPEELKNKIEGLN